MSDVGERLMTFRKNAGLSQTDLSKISGVSQTAISYIETGRNDPSISTAALLANALRIPVQELIGSSAKGKKPAVADDSGLAETVRQMVLDLPDDDLLKVYGFVSGLLSARSKT